MAAVDDKTICNEKSNTTYQKKEDQLTESELRFRKACCQIVILNKQLQDMKERYARAKNDNFRSFRYNLRLKLAVLEGVRNMYYEYARLKVENIAKLRLELFGEIVEIVSGEYDDEDEDEHQGWD